MKKQSSFVSMGITSLFLIFSVFGLVILSLLTYHTSRSDRAAASQSLAQTAAYYSACSHAADLYTELNTLLQENGASVSTDPEAICSLSLPENVLYDTELHRFTILCSVSETQELLVTLELSVSDDSAPALAISEWRTRAAGEWNPDLHQNVYQKGADS